VIELRERLIFKLAVLVGLRPGEIFGLRRTRLSENTADIQERIYRGRMWSPSRARADEPLQQIDLNGVQFSTLMRGDSAACQFTTTANGEATFLQFILPLCRLG
jgi:hypothetical protein